MSNFTNLQFLSFQALFSLLLPRLLYNILMLKIVHVPNEVLITPTKPVTKFDTTLKKLVIDMEETLIVQKDPQGVGLAATQIGKDLALFIIKPEPEADTKVFINPRILNLDWEKPKKPKKNDDEKDEVPLEGCLSIPKIWSPVERAYRVQVEFQDVNGEKHTDWFEDFEATIIQHEVDHLNGILFTQRAIEQKSPFYEEKGDELKKVEF
jgi:peptide deformylase